jgi:DNA-3-methyladenine glycosylase II
MQVNFIRSEEDLTSAYLALVKQCDLMRGLVETLPRPGLRLDEGGYAGLCRIIAFQQISISAGNAIWGRFMSLMPVITPEIVINTPDEVIKTAGLSRGKIKTMKALAIALIENTATLESPQSLLAVSGIGPWTVEIYRLSCQGDADVWPAGDIALQQALGDLLGLEARPSAKETLPLVEKWVPYRAVAARLLWGLYRKNKSMMPV